MTTTHTELCECDCLNYCGDDPDLSRRKARPCRSAIDWAHEQALAIEAERERQRKVDLFESQAARIQQQAARIAELEKERDVLKVDAKRLRKLESDGVLHDIAPVIRWQTVMRFEPAKSSLNCRWTSEMKAVYVEQPIREIKLRWVDENNDRPTLLHMIDAALQAEKETR